MRELALNLFGYSFSGFTNRAREEDNVLYWHRNVCSVLRKRLEQERFTWPRLNAQAVAHKINLKGRERPLERFDLWTNRLH